jgi:hypothetical protein
LAAYSRPPSSLMASTLWPYKLPASCACSSIRHQCASHHETWPLDNCPICIKAKLHKAARGVDSFCRATQCYQGISVNFGFIVQHSSADSARVKRLSGLHGETCYCLLVDQPL